MIVQCVCKMVQSCEYQQHLTVSPPEVCQPSLRHSSSLPAVENHKATQNLILRPKLPSGRGDHGCSLKPNLPLPSGRGDHGCSLKPNLPLPSGRGDHGCSLKPNLPLPSGRGDHGCSLKPSLPLEAMENCEGKPSYNARFGHNHETQDTLRYIKPAHP